MKKAFTMLELIFVIIVIGILSAIILPSTKRNPLAESAADLLSMVRYTQHLALIDDKYEKSTVWYKDRWQIKFSGNKYSIVSNNNTTYAKNPSNINKNIKNIDLGTKYGVTITVNGTECATGIGENIISFDYLGRPFAGNLNTATGAYSNVLMIRSNDCNIVLSSGTKSATINIAPETGYAKLTYN